MGNLDDRPTDNTRIALLLQAQQRDEEKIKELESRIDAIDKQVFAGKIVLLTLIGLGTFFGWLINTGDKVRSWFH